MIGPFFGQETLFHTCYTEISRRFRRVKMARGLHAAFSRGRNVHPGAFVEESKCGVGRAFRARSEEIRSALISCTGRCLRPRSRRCPHLCSRSTRTTKPRTSLIPEFNQSLPKFRSRQLGRRGFIPVSGQQAGVVLIRKALVEQHNDPAIGF